MWLPGKVPKESRRCPTGTNKKIYPLQEVKWSENMVVGWSISVSFSFFLIVFIVVVLDKISLESMSKRIALLENKIVWVRASHSPLYIDTPTYTHKPWLLTVKYWRGTRVCVSLHLCLYPELSQTTSVSSFFRLTSSTPLGLLGREALVAMGTTGGLRRSSSKASLCVC